MDKLAVSEWIVFSEMDLDWNLQIYYDIGN